MRGSSTPTASAVATAASKAFPPSCRIRMPAMEARGSSDVTMAWRAVIRGRSTSWASAAEKEKRINAGIPKTLARSNSFGLTCWLLSDSGLKRVAPHFLQLTWRLPNVLIFPNYRPVTLCDSAHECRQHDAYQCSHRFYEQHMSTLDAPAVQSLWVRSSWE